MPDDFETIRGFKVVGIIQPSKLSEVKEALAQFRASGMTVTEVRGYGRQMGRFLLHGGPEYEVNYVPKIKIEVVTGSMKAANLFCELICNAARTGRIGDGKIWVEPVTGITRIRTGDKGSDAA